MIKIFQILFKKYPEQRVGQVPICTNGGLYIYTFMTVQVWHINIPGVIHKKAGNNMLPVEGDWNGRHAFHTTFYTFCTA